MRRSVVLRRAVTSNFLRNPEERVTFYETLREHDKQGLDMASNLTSDFVSIQAQLIKYRIVRLSDEMSHLYRNPTDGIPALSSVPLHVLCLLTMYLLGKILGRSDTQPLVAPATTSVAAAAVEATHA